MPPVRPQYSRAAERQADDLFAHYATLERPEAVRNLIRALADAETRIMARPEKGLPAPRPYPALARKGRLWLKAGPYWITYSDGEPSVILGVFHEAADIPRRF